VGARSPPAAAFLRRGEVWRKKKKTKARKTWFVRWVLLDRALFVL
jgi:hypothetical protein